MIHGEVPVQEAFVCSKCGRVLYTDPTWAAYADEIDNWLIAGVDGGVYVRCPRHLTMWALECCGISKGKASRYWMLIAERRDWVALGPSVHAQRIAPYPVMVKFESRVYE